MPKIDKKAIIALCNEMNKKEKDKVFSIDSSVERIPRWSTGIAELDNIIGGGMPEGRIIEIFGAESAGKTSLLHHLTAQHEMALQIPIEGTFDAERAKAFGNRHKQLILDRSKTGEAALNTVTKFAKAGMPIIGVDSVPSLQPKDDIEKIQKAIEKNTIEELRIGGVARLLTKYLPNLESIIEVSGTTVIFINQIRDLMNAMPFGEKTTTTGGHKLKHAASIRLQVARKGDIKIVNYNPQDAATNEIIGIIMKIKVVKSKVCNPRGECEIPLIFDRGFISYDELDDVKKEIVAERKERYKKKR